jgi:hypothetical protein
VKLENTAATGDQQLASNWPATGQQLASNWPAIDNKFTELNDQTS